MLILAAARSLTPFLIWLGVLIAAVVGAGVFLMLYRSSVLGKEGMADSGGVLADLRAMRDRGEITPEEFDAAKAAMAARLSGRSPGTEPPAPGAVRGARRDGLVAPPGFDLTGRPLPRAGGKDSPDR